MKLIKVDNSTYINEELILSIEGYIIRNEEKYCIIRMVDGMTKYIPLNTVEEEFGITFNDKKANGPSFTDINYR